MHNKCDCHICLNKVCGNSGCCTFSYDEIDKLIYDINFQIIGLTDSVVNRLRNGIGCKTNDFKEIITLNLYKDVLENTKRLLYVEKKNCVCDKTLCKLKENVLELIKIPCYEECRSDITITRDNEMNWIAQNPYCVSREKWEELTYHVCDGIQLEITKEELKCDLVFDIVKQVIPCEVLFNIQVQKELCDLGLEVSRTKEDCKLDYKLLVEKHNCDLEFKDYMCLIDCNLSFDFINTVYGCGLRLSIDKNNGTPLLVTGLNTYPLNSLHFKGKMTKQHVDFLNKISGKEQCINFSELSKKLKQDYK